MLTPLLGGAVIYYSVRKTHPKTAAFANSMSALGFLAWALVVWRWHLDDDRLLLGILGALGMIATDISIRLIRRSEPELDQIAIADAPPNEELKPTATPSSLVK